MRRPAQSSARSSSLTREPAVGSETTPPTLIDETAKARLKHFARLLILAISRPEHRTLELAPHPCDEERWRQFFDHVFHRARTVADLRTAVADADTVEALLVAYGLTPTGAAHWAEQYRREMQGWLRMAAGASEPGDREPG